MTGREENGELETEVKSWGPLDSFLSFSLPLVAKDVSPTASTLELFSGFLFSSIRTRALFLIDPQSVIGPKASSTAVVAVVAVERDSNKLLPQLPISANASCPRLNLGGASEYLFFFFAGTTGEIDNDGMLNSRGGNESGSSHSSP